MGGSSTISSEAPRVGALRYQQSTYGTVVPIVYGRTRISGNLIWYGDFTAIAHTTTTEQGGKGGGGVKQQSTTYTYTAAVAMAICEGPINAITTIWKDKASYTNIGELGLSLATGAEGQAVWGHLTTNHADQALAYSGTAYLYSATYQLSDNAEVVNHTFEVSTPWEFSSSNFDALPSAFAVDALTNDRYGAMFPAANIGTLDRWRDYCKAAGLLISPALTEQREMRDWLSDWAQVTNSAFYWSEGKLKVEPYGDQTITGNGTTFIANTTAIYDLTDDDFLAEPGEDPVRVMRASPADAYNQVQIEFLNRANAYNAEVITAYDQRNIEEFGLRPAPVSQQHHITTQEVARTVAQLMLQRHLYVRNTYEFRLGWKYCLLEPMDLVTITDAGLGLDRAPVRIVSAEEDATGTITIQAEDFPAGVASSPAYPVEPATGFSHQYNATPGPVAPPVFFEPPVELTTTGLEVWAAVTGTAPNWGGCEVWASYSGANYKRVGTIRGGARYGTLSGALASSATAGLAVNLVGNGGKMLSGDATEAARLSTLCMVKAPGGKPEFLAYETALLTGSNAYTLSGLVRGAYSSAQAAHASGAAFVRVDEAIFKGEPLQASAIGQTVRFKFVSFNVYGKGHEDIASVVEYPYTITGDMALLPPPNVPTFTINIQADGTRQFNWGWGSSAKPVDLKGYVVRYRQGAGPYTWEQLLPFATDDGFHTASPIESNLLLAGPYTFAIKTLDVWGVEAKDALFIAATLPDPRLGNAMEFVDEGDQGWPGTLTDCVRESWDGQLIVRARDQATWATLPSTWAAWTRWVWDPVASFTYETQPVDFGAAVAVLPVASWQVDVGDVTYEVASSADGTTWGAWAPVSGPIVTRYIKTRLTVTVPAGSGAGSDRPVLVLRSLRTSYIGKVSNETGNDQLTSGFDVAHRIGVGDVRLPIQKQWVHVSRVTVALQNVSGGWSWTLVDKDGTNGPRIKIFNGTAPADALIDWTVEGIST